MKSKTLFLLLISVIVFTCCRNKYEKRLVGNWYSIDENEKIILEKDSIYLGLLNYKVKWFSTKDSLKFNYKNVFNDSLHKIALKYSLQNDTLYIIPNNDSLKVPIKFVRTNNFLDYLFFKNKVNIKLPINYNVGHLLADPKYGIKIFLDLDNDTIRAKTQYSKNLNNLNKDLEKHISIFNEEINQFKNDYSHVYEGLNNQQLKMLWVKFHIHFSIFADKEITRKELRFYYNNLKKIKQINKIYRVYDIDESKYVSFYRLKGVKL